MERIYLISYSYKSSHSEIPLFGNITLGISGKVTQETIESVTEQIRERVALFEIIDGDPVILAMSEIGD